MIQRLVLSSCVVYPELDTITYNDKGETYFTQAVVDLWNKIPFFRDNMNKVPTLHITMKKDDLKKALESSDYKIQTKTKA